MMLFYKLIRFIYYVVIFLLAFLASFIIIFGTTYVVKENFSLLKKLEYKLDRLIDKNAINYAGVIHKVDDAIVKIKYVPDGVGACNEREIVRCGTGVVIYSDSKKSYILTNRHIAGDSIECGQEIHTRYSKQPYQGRTIRVDRLADLALIKVDRFMPAVNIAEANVNMEEDLFTAGNSYCWSRVVDKGITTDYDLRILGSWANQITVHTYPGNSGSPIFNRWGRVVGLIYAGHQRVYNLGFYVPLRSIKEFLRLIDFPNLTNKVYLPEPRVKSIDDENEEYYHPIWTIKNK